MESVSSVLRNTLHVISVLLLNNFFVFDVIKDKSECVKEVVNKETTELVHSHLFT